MNIGSCRRTRNESQQHTALPACPHQRHASPPDARGQEHSPGCAIAPTHAPPHPDAHHTRTSRQGRPCTRSVYMRSSLRAWPGCMSGVGRACAMCGEHSTCVVSTGSAACTARASLCSPLTALAHAFVFIYVCVCACACVCVCVRARARAYVCMCVCAYIHACACMDTGMHAHRHRHRHRHTNTNPLFPGEIKLISKALPRRLAPPVKAPVLRRYTKICPKLYRVCVCVCVCVCACVHACVRV